MIRRQLVLAVSTIAIALLSACADATGPTANDCQTNNGSGTQCVVSK